NVNATSGTVIGARTFGSVITSATNSGAVANTITTSAPHNLTTNQTVAITGVNVAGYNGLFTVTSTPTPTTFTFNSAAVLTAGATGGFAVLANAPINPAGTSTATGNTTASILGTSTANIVAGTAGATESGNTVTITTTAAHNFTVGETVVDAGVTNNG